MVICDTSLALCHTPFKIHFTNMCATHLANLYYSCGLSTASIEYLKNNGSIHLKLEHIVVYENSSDEFDIGHCPIKAKVMA